VGISKEECLALILTLTLALLHMHVPRQNAEVNNDAIDNDKVNDDDAIKMYQVH
jgi:hypothetical protein